MIHANCSACGTQFTVSDEMAGRCCPCTSCGGQVVFPSPMQRPGVNVQCGRCGNVYLVPAEYAGAPTQCGRCGNLVPPPGAPGMPGYGPPPGAMNMPAAPTKPQPAPSPYAMDAQYGQPRTASPVESSNRGKLLAVAIIGGVLGLALVVVVALVMFSNNRTNALEQRLNPNNASGSGNTPVKDGSTALGSGTKTNPIARLELNPITNPTIELVWNTSTTNFERNFESEFETSFPHIGI